MVSFLRKALVSPPLEHRGLQSLYFREQMLVLEKIVRRLYFILFLIKATALAFQGGLLER